VYGEVEVQPHLFLTLALSGSGWSHSVFGVFTPGKQARHPSVRRLGGSVWRWEKHLLLLPRLEPRFLWSSSPQLDWDIWTHVMCGYCRHTDLINTASRIMMAATRAMAMTTPHTM